MDKRVQPQQLLDFLTDRARKALSLARQAADRHGGGKLELEHVLTGLIEEGAGVAALTIENLGVPLRRLHQRLEARATERNAAAPTVRDQPPPADSLSPGGEGARPARAAESSPPDSPEPELAALFAAACAETRRLGHPWLGTEHLLLGLLGVGGSAAELLGEHDVTLERARAEVLLLTAPAVGTADARPPRPAAAGSRPAAAKAAEPLSPETQELYQAIVGRLGEPSPEPGSSTRTPRTSELKRLERAILMLEERRDEARQGERDETVMAVDQGLIELRRRLLALRRKRPAAD